MFTRNIQVKIAINTGTRLEITRMSPVMHEGKRQGVGHLMQHDRLGNSDDMSGYGLMNWNILWKIR
ncbi:MAG: hypothetical protein HF976_15260 [ANME-2 cluster archaeon]|nr:hypothetical protein [ANME-2 cluster archaeon]MBC2702734.1 hypothetical protein [ANME-2 cluster archaeon]MBC2706278.1 hypothetical protein [ANME-2 cluster archaeon]MBC2746617.1 hypothetical protein [ANME-2 cluster archaeon]MBC2764262.1 hypothetical protein [ANME-2 cluster archaeon]